MLLVSETDCVEYGRYGQLEFKGTYNMGKLCGEWVRDGETVTYPSCPLGN
jgi:hypothetical protein